MIINLCTVTHEHDLRSISSTQIKKLHYLWRTQISYFACNIIDTCLMQHSLCRYIRCLSLIILHFVVIIADVPRDYDSRGKACKNPCYLNSDCENCTAKGCMWCSNQQKCVETNSYVASFIYGQCMEWTTDKGKCSGQSSCCCNKNKFPKFLGFVVPL